MDAVDRQIINRLQDGFPVCQFPYREIAEQLQLGEQELLMRLQVLLDEGILSRFGPMYHAEQMGGALTLAALKVPDSRFEAVADIVNAFPEVAHNYARHHVLNMWFVIATEQPQQVEAVIQAIASQTGLSVFNMPKIDEYFVGLKLEA